MDRLVVGPSPFIKSKNSASILSAQKILVLSILVVVGVCLTGYKSAVLFVVSLLSAIIFEFLYNFLVYDKKIIEDWSCVVTALTYVCIAQVNTPFYVAIIAMFFAVVVVKMVFGGFANNMFNLAGSGAMFVSLIFAASSNLWAVERGVDYAASPISNLISGNFENFNVVDFLIGDVSGAIGVICGIAVLAGAVYLIVFRIIDLKMPLIAILSYLIFAFVLNGFDVACLLPYLFSGIMLFVSFFMLTDYTTSPNTTLGQIIYALIFGILSATFIKINLFGEMGVIVALLIANCFTPLFDRIIRPHYFGEGK